LVIEFIINRQDNMEFNIRKRKIVTRRQL